MIVALAAGHSSSHQGATAVDGAREWAWQRDAVARIAQALDRRGIRRVVFERGPGPYSVAGPALAAAVNEAQPTIAIEVHFDAGPPAWRGPTGIHWPGSIVGERWARELATAVGRITGHRGRWRGEAVSHAGLPMYWLRDIRCPAVVLETHFGSNIAEHAALTAARNEGRLAEAIASAIAGG